MSRVRAFARPVSLPAARRVPPRPRVGGLGSALLALALVSSVARPSAAQDAGTLGTVEDDNGANIAKGMIGGGMLGAEIVMLTESALRLRPGWAYLLGGAAGAAGGAYLGYVICDESTNRPPAFLLAGGIALIIPTIMGVLTATQYEPSGPLQHDTDDAATDEDSGKKPAPASGARLDLPGVGVAQAFSREDLARFRVRQATELHLTFLRGVF